MGVVYSTYFPTVPAAGTWAFVKFMRGLLKIRLRACPIARDTVRYVALDASSGSATGGGGAGSPGNPYLVRQLADFVTLYGNIVATGMTILLRRGDRFKGTSGLSISTAKVTLGAYGSGNRPTIEGFENDDGTGWTDSGSGDYTKTVTGTVLWVRLQEAPATNLEAGTETVFTKQTSAATVQGTNNSWWQTGATLHVRVGANASPATTLIDVCKATGVGLLVTDVDGVRLDSLSVLGWGTESVASNNYCIQTRLSGTNECVVTNCGAYYGAQHVLGQLLSGGGNSGGITTWSHCDFGLGRVDGSAGFTAFVSFSNDGGHETILHDYDCKYGALPDSGSVGWDATKIKRGQPWYCHQGGAFSPALALMLLGRTRSHAYGCAFNGCWGDCPAYTTNRAALSEYRAWIVGDRFDGGSNTYFYPPLTNQIALWCKWVCSTPADYSTTATWIDTAYKNAIVGCSLDMTFTGGAGVARRLFSGATDQYIDFAFCHFKYTLAAGDYLYYDPRDSASGYKTAHNRLFNGIFSENASAFTAPFAATNNAAPAAASETATADGSITGGGRNCLFYRGGPTHGTDNFLRANSGNNLGYDQFPAYIDEDNTASLLSGGEPALGTVPISTSYLYQAACTEANLPFTVEWWYDHANRYIYDMPSNSSDIGPVQHNWESIVKDYRNRRLSFQLRP